MWTLRFLNGNLLHQEEQEDKRASFGTMESIMFQRHQVKRLLLHIPIGLLIGVILAYYFYIGLALAGTLLLYLIILWLRGKDPFPYARMDCGKVSYKIILAHVIIIKASEAAAYAAARSLLA